MNFSFHHHHYLGSCTFMDVDGYLPADLYPLMIVRYVMLQVNKSVKRLTVNT